MLRKIIKETNSYFSIEEFNKLENKLNFKWSNMSNNSSEGYDNCMYKYENSIRFDIEVKKNMFTVRKNFYHLFGDKYSFKTYDNFDDLIKNLPLSFSDTIKQYIYKLNALIFGILFLIVTIPFILLFGKMKNKKDLILSKTKDIFNFNYYFLQDALPFVWGLNLFVIGSCFSLFFVS